MRRHPSSFELHCFAAGTLSPGRGIQVVKHLIRGCPACSEQLEPVVATSDESSSRERGTPEIYDTAIDRAYAAALVQTAGPRRPRRASIRVLALLSVHGRRWSELTDSQKRRLKALPRVEALFQEARSMRHGDPRKLLLYAALAKDAAEALSVRRYGSRTVADLRALMWAELGNAHRIATQFDDAHLALKQAAAWCSRGSHEPSIQAEIGSFVACFLEDQRRFKAAFELLDRVVDLYTELGDDHNTGRALIQKGTYAGLNNQQGTGMRLICRGLSLLDGDREPGLYLAALHNLLIFMVDEGSYRAARIHLWRLKPVFLAEGGARRVLHLRWLEGRIDVGLERLDRAEEAFRETQAGFEELDEVYSAALVSMDLAALLLRQGRMDEVLELAEAQIATFRALRIAREAVAVLLIICKDCKKQRATLDQIETAVMMLKELERQPVRRIATDGSPA